MSHKKGTFTQLKWNLFPSLFFQIFKKSTHKYSAGKFFHLFSEYIIPNDTFLIHLIEMNETVEMENENKSNHDNNTTHSDFDKWGLVGGKMKSETENRKMERTKKRKKSTQTQTHTIQR